MANVFITGINGFIGLALARDLSHDHRVLGLGFDRQKTLSGIDIVYGDIRDQTLIARLLSEYEITDVYHLASQSIVRICETNPVSAYDINIMGTVNLLEACRKMPSIRSITVSTSDKVFGHSPPPYNEETLFMPRFIYETSKACQDMIAMSFAESYNLPVKIVRCSNVYGPGDLNLSRLIPCSITNLLRNKPPVIYSGVKDYVRDFVYIDDVIRAMKLISEYGVSGEAYCVGTEKQYKILDVIEMIRVILGSNIEVEIREKTINFHEIEKQWMDCSKLIDLGWTSKTKLYDGLAKTIEYYKEIL